MCNITASSNQESPRESPPEQTGPTYISPPFPLKLINLLLRPPAHLPPIVGVVTMPASTSLRDCGAVTKGEPQQMLDGESHSC